MIAVEEGNGKSNFLGSEKFQKLPRDKAITLISTSPFPKRQEKRERASSQLCDNTQYTRMLSHITWNNYLLFTTRTTQPWQHFSDNLLTILNFYKEAFAVDITIFVIDNVHQHTWFIFSGDGGTVQCIG